MIHRTYGAAVAIVLEKDAIYFGIRLFVVLNDTWSETFKEQDSRSDFDYLVSLQRTTRSCEFQIGDINTIFV